MLLRPSTPTDGPRVIEIWRAAVEATHDFLSAADLVAIDAQVRGFLPDAALVLAVDANDRPVAFMGLSEGSLDSLFIDPAFRGAGIGRRMVEHAARLYSQLSVDVNEQNAQAVGFYERMGFVRTGRSPIDGDGRPYPLIHMALTR